MSGKMKPVFSPQPSGETEPAPKASGETETSPEPSGEAELPQRHRARRNQTPVIRTRDITAPLSVQKFLTFGGYWFHLLGYPGIRSLTHGFKTKVTSHLFFLVSIHVMLDFGVTKVWCG